MAKYPRLLLAAPLNAGAAYRCNPTQANYLRNALRLESGAHVLVFNGQDGEWLAELRLGGKRDCRLIAREKLREQESGPPLHYIFAPLKKARLDYMAQKAVEMGVASIRPVFTRRTNVARINEKRLAANMVEAAEQCGILHLAELRGAMKLEALLAGWPDGVPLVFCDEAAPVKSPLAALAELPRGGETGLLIGPEGGFDDDERGMLAGKGFVHPISLGPRIMRADTAAVAALALLNAVLFDWR